VTDELALRELFFGEGDGKNYAALCHAPTSSGSNAKPLPISSVFQDAKSDGAATAEFVLVDCTYILPSGKSIADRFELDLSKRPTIFLSGKIGPPKQIPDKHLKTGQMLVKALKHKLEPPFLFSMIHEFCPTVFILLDFSIDFWLFNNRN